MFAPPICRRSRRNASRTELILRHGRFVGFDEDGGSPANIAASGAIKHGSRAAVLRRREGTCLFVPERRRSRRLPSAIRAERAQRGAAVAPRSELPFARSTKIPHVDQRPVWSVWCIRVRPGHRGKGISHALLDGAVAYARAQSAPAVEGYPVDNRGEKVDLTMVHVGICKLFEDAGFVKAADTRSISGGFHVC
jgi:GNAT superfamily N-acetyltransferase